MVQFHQPPRKRFHPNFTIYVRMYYLSPGGWEKHPSALREPARNISRRIFTWLQRSRKTACRLFPRGYRPVSLSLCAGTSYCIWWKRKQNPNWFLRGLISPNGGGKCGEEPLSHPKNKIYKHISRHVGRFLCCGLRARWHGKIVRVFRVLAPLFTVYYFGGQLAPS